MSTITFKNFLNEGGWSKTITQSVKLTPAIAKAAVELMPRFEEDFNNFLKSKGAAPISIGKPVGSSAYIERDLKSNPDKEYGDIDILMNVPRVEGLTDSKNNSLYSNYVKEFVATQDHPYLYKDDENGGQNIIVKIGDDYVQVDLVKAFSDISDWATHRMTPEYGVKGALMGFMYAALAEVLYLSIGAMGVQAKERDGQLVPFRQLKVDKVHTFTTDIGKFGLDILHKLFEMQGSGDLKVDPHLIKMPGIDRSNIKIRDIISVIIGLGKSFELNDMYGKGNLKHISDIDDFISKVKQVYLSKAEEAANASKFDKAETPEAIKKAADTKKMLLTKSKEIAANLHN